MKEGFLGRYHLFAGLEEKELNRLAMRVKESKFEKREVILREGEECPDNPLLYLIDKGEVSLIEKDSQGISQKIGVMGSGNIFGIENMTGKLRGLKTLLLTYKASPEVTVYTLSNEDLKQALSKAGYVSMTLNITRYLSRWMRACLERCATMEMQSKERTKWIKKRFGNIPEGVLGKIDETKEVIWPDLTKEYKIKGNILRYQRLDIEKTVGRIAEIYANGLDEVVGNSEYEWHQFPNKIQEKVKTGDWNFYGCYYENILFFVTSIHIIRGQRIMQWVWSCCDPKYRGKGAFIHFAEYLDEIAEKSNAHLALAWVVTTHKLSQMALEKVGFIPVGFFIGGEFFGGSDGRYYRHNAVWYEKIYESGSKNLYPPLKDMELTEKVEDLVNVVVSQV
jgi:CRP-like cAMP-binding protein/RimJ/RimL family protein N-acetyltransferase